MDVGFHFLSDVYREPVLPAAAFLDVAGAGAGMRSKERLCRIFFKGRPAPRDVAKKALAWAVQGCRVQVGNEPNLADEGFGGTPDDFAAWFAEVAALAPTARLYWPGISPGVPGWQDWYAGACAEAIRRHASGIALHAYGSALEVANVLSYVLTNHFGKPIWLAECNFGAGRKVDRDAWARDELPRILRVAEVACEAFTYFTYRWPTPDIKLPTPVDAAGTAIEDAIATYRPKEATTDTQGIDISNNNGVVDFGRLAASDRRFAFVKASEDDAFIDPYLKANLDGLKRLGWGRGVYHFARPSIASPAASVTLLQQALDRSGWGEPGDAVALDIEDPNVPEGTSLHRWVAEWLDLAERVFGVAPWKYSGRWYTSTRDLEHDDLARYPTWWAAYQSAEPAPVTGWGPIKCWQYSADGEIDGIAGDVDLDVFHGTLDDFKALGKVGASPAPAPPPAPDPVATALADLKAATARLEEALARR